MEMEDLLQSDDKATVMRALLLRHRHVNESGGFHFPRRKFSSYTSLQVIKKIILTVNFSHHKLSITIVLSSFDDMNLSIYCDMTISVVFTYFYFLLFTICASFLSLICTSPL